MAKEQITVGQQIGVLTGYATGHCALATSMVHAVVVGETEKALQLQAVEENGSLSPDKCWLPRKAILDSKGSFSLAKWFRPEGYTAHWLSRHVHHAILTA